MQQTISRSQPHWIIHTLKYNAIIPTCLLYAIQYNPFVDAMYFSKELA